jgi:PIN domain
VEIQRRLVLDANILIRAVLGRRVRQIITDHTDRVAFFASAAAYADARRHLPILLDKRFPDADTATALIATRARLPHLDRGPGLLRYRRPDLDD